ncbi:MAG: DNA repair protein RecN [Bifidobacterium sp.]|jgi:DNA repair protein RecN (Recombination protein N)|nr:DNA repair protein RecN [Bifidobacterium sp.]
MLEELEIRNLGPIRQARISPSPGMNAITGETGAGKSMLLSAIQLISGGQADAGRISPDAQEAWAQGVFTAVGDDARDIVREAGADGGSDDEGLFLSRTVPSSGRSRAVLSGKSVPRAVLSNVASQLVTIHGQADQLRIVSAARQRDFLDMTASDDRELSDYRGCWQRLQRVDERLKRLKSQESSVRQRKDYLSESIERIERVDPQEGEDSQLKERRTRIEHAAEITTGVNDALHALDASQVDVDAEEPDASALINRAIQSLRSIGVKGSLSEAADRLTSIRADLSDVVFSLSNEVPDEDGVEDLDTINARIHDLDELVRRWGPTLDDVRAWHRQAMLDVQDLDASPEKIVQIEAERSELLSRTVAAARRLSDARRKAAKDLGDTVSRELDSLAMPGSRLLVRVESRLDASSPADPRDGTDDDAMVLDSHGGDDIEFMFLPFPGSTPLPMSKSASGGELSRLMLAMELAAARRHSGHSSMTFIFDEVDAGVGGKAAMELGRRLAALSRHSQVIVVTHLAQVASWADSQFVVSKEDERHDGVLTRVHEVKGDGRVHEIARMLAGSESPTSLEHAEELLESSR